MNNKSGKGRLESGASRKGQQPLASLARASKRSSGSPSPFLIGRRPRRRPSNHSAGISKWPHGVEDAYACRWARLCRPTTLSQQRPKDLPMLSGQSPRRGPPTEPACRQPHPPLGRMLQGLHGSCSGVVVI